MDIPEALLELEAAGWPDLADRLLQGFCHGLNGRISSLLGLVYLAQKGGGGDSTWVHPMETELERMEKLVRLMEGVPHGGTGHAEPTSLGEIVPGVLEIHGLQKGLEGVELAHRMEEAPPVFLNRTVLVRCLLLLLSWVAEHARRAGQVVVEVSLAEEDGGAGLTLRPRGNPSVSESAPPGAPGRSGIALREGMLDRLEGVLASSGGRLVADGAGAENVQVKIWLPSLAQAKQNRES